MTSLRLAAALAALALLPASRLAAEDVAPAAPAAHADPTRMLADLRTPLTQSFSTGSWQDRVSTTPTGCLVLGNKGADGKGEIGQNLEPLLDLSAVKYVEIAVATAPKNEVPAVTIAFNDADDTQFTATLAVDALVPGQPVWLRAKLSDFKLNDWRGDKAGKRIDWHKIRQWHLQGDWRTEAPCHVMFIALRVRS